MQPSSSAAPSTSTEAAAPPQECLDYDGPEMTYSDSEAAIVEAADRAALPATVVLNPGIQFVPSIDEPDMLEAVVRICSAPLTEEGLLEVGNEIAKAIYGEPASESLTLLMVSPWLPSGEYLDQDPNLDPISTDYELFLWDADRPLDGNWD